MLVLSIPFLVRAERPERIRDPVPGTYASQSAPKQLKRCLSCRWKLRLVSSRFAWRKAIRTSRAAVQERNEASHYEHLNLRSKRTPDSPRKSRHLRNNMAAAGLECKLNRRRSPETTR